MRFYTYVIINVVDDMYYIGSRGTEMDPQVELGIKYFQSQTDSDFMKHQKNNPEIFKYKIIAEHNTRNEAMEAESKLHEFFKVQSNKKFYNKSIVKSKYFNTYGRILVSDKDGNKFTVTRDDPRYLSGELKYIMAGRVVVKDTNGDTLCVNVDDPRYINGQLTFVTMGKVTTKDHNGNIFSVSSDDIRLKTGELVGNAKGNVSVKDVNGNTMQVQVDDERFKCGTLVHVTKNYTTTKDHYGNILHVHKDDPRLKSGELVGITKGNKVVKDKDGKTFVVSRDDPRIASGIFSSVNSGRIYMNNGVKNKMVFPSEVKKFEEQGFVRGMIKGATK